MTYKPEPFTLLSEIKSIYFAWWHGSRGTIWFWLVPLMVITTLLTAIGSPVAGWHL